MFKFIHDIRPFRLLVNRLKHTLDHSKVPILSEKDLDEQFVKGSGPGGQAVNKTVNCVVLTHKPTGIVIKCHESRLLNRNREIARSLLISKLDSLYNGEQSVVGQIKLVQQKKINEQERRRKKLSELKRNWKEREGLE